MKRKNLKRWGAALRPSKGPALSLSKGFTLIELLVVIAIIGLLMTMALPAITGAMDSANIKSDANNVRQIGQAIENYLIGKGKGRMPIRPDHTVNGETLTGSTDAVKMANALFYGRSPVLTTTVNFASPGDSQASPAPYVAPTTAPFVFDIEGTGAGTPPGMSYVFRTLAYAPLVNRGGGASPVVATRGGIFAGSNIFMNNKSVQWFDTDAMYDTWPYSSTTEPAYDDDINDANGNPLLSP